MFRYYLHAKLCLVYLADVHKSIEDRFADLLLEQLRACRWFTRGWTLQELLAPKWVGFFDVNSQFIGTKEDLAVTIEQITSIPISLLRGTRDLRSFTLQERLSWAGKRTTRKEEDHVYSLFGILETSFPPNYGEGRDQAWTRLRQALVNAYQHQLLTLDFSQCGAGGQNVRNIVSIQALTGTNVEAKTDWKALLLEYLTFPQRDLRKHNIQKQTTKTCEWLLTHQTYLDWQDPGEVRKHNGLLWIRGKPGAGKSTLLKFADGQAVRAKPRGDSVISFYFNARGTLLERSVEGMYRSLLCQLIDLISSETLNSLSEVLSQHVKSRQAAGWSKNDLQMLFQVLVASVEQQRLTVFIDALDESDEEDVRELIRFLEDVGLTAIEHNRHLLVCLASRHYPTIDSIYGLRMNLDEEIGHADDLKEHVKRTLRLGNHSALPAIRSRLVAKANGLFIWAVLVIKMLNTDYEQACFQDMLGRLEQIPESMSSLFRQIVGQDQRRIDDFRLCLQWLLYAQRPLTPLEFYHAMHAARMQATNACQQGSIASPAEHDLVRYVSSTSKGLAEVSLGSGKRVQFIHETVRDYLLKQEGMSELWQSEPDLAGNSHLRLMTICRHYIQDPQLLELVHKHKLASVAKQRQSSWNEELISYFPLLHYATTSILKHAEYANETSAVDDFLASFDLNLWHTLHADVIADGLAILRDADELLHVLARGNAARLIAIAVKSGHQLEHTEPTHGRTPLLLACLHGSVDALLKLLQLGANINAIDVHGDSALVLAIYGRASTELIRVLINAGVDTSIRRLVSESATHKAFRAGRSDILKLLADRADTIIGHDLVLFAADHHNPMFLEALNVNAKLIDRRDKHGRTALHTLCRSEDSSLDKGRILRILTSLGCDVNAHDAAGRTPLEILLLQDSRPGSLYGAVSAMLDAGAELCIDEQGNTALMRYLSYQGRYSDPAVASLLAWYVDARQINHAGESALTMAERRGEPLRSAGWVRALRMLQ